jgi:hypothetical protein
MPLCSGKGKLTALFHQVGLISSFDIAAKHGELGGSKLLAAGRRTCMSQNCYGKQLLDFPAVCSCPVADLRESKTHLLPFNIFIAQGT